MLYVFGHIKTGAHAPRRCIWWYSLVIDDYSMISVTTPDPTVLPPSLIAKRSPSSIATGVSVRSPLLRYLRATSLYPLVALDLL